MPIILPKNTVFTIYDTFFAYGFDISVQQPFTLILKWSSQVNWSPVLHFTFYKMMALNICCDVCCCLSFVCNIFRPYQYQLNIGDKHLYFVSKRYTQLCICISKIDQCKKLILLLLNKIFHVTVLLLELYRSRMGKYSSVLSKSTGIHFLNSVYFLLWNKEN